MMKQELGKKAMGAQQTGDALSGPDRKSRFLLVVDSDANNLYYMSMVLQRLDYQLSTAMTGEEAMALAKVAAPSLVIMALDLKDMSGLELMRKLPGIAGAPIIAIRKQADLLGEKRCLELGAIACLSAPLSAEKLFRAVQAAVETTPRTSIRIRTFLSVEMNGLPLDGRNGARAVVLSEGGMFLPTSRPSPIDTRLALQIELKNELILAEAVVLYSHHTGSGPYQEPGMGVEFVRISTGGRDLIRRFIRDEVTRGILPLSD